VVLCVQEITKIQALEKIQSLLPNDLAYVEAVTHDYIRLHTPRYHHSVSGGG
jgi:hypothetical protein